MCSKMGRHISSPYGLQYLHQNSKGNEIALREVFSNNHRRVMHLCVYLLINVPRLHVFPKRRNGKRMMVTLLVNQQNTLEWNHARVCKGCLPYFQENSKNAIGTKFQEMLYRRKSYLPYFQERVPLSCFGRNMVHSGFRLEILCYFSSLIFFYIYQQNHIGSTG